MLRKRAAVGVMARRGTVVLALAATGAFAAGAPEKPVDPFDYSYCGGKPVYPVIGYNFATACGPRNQIVVGRRGQLMWLYPSADGRIARHQGVRQLTAKELGRISLLAEAVELAGAVDGPPAAVMFDLGINFSGRPNRRMHAAYTASDAPASELLRTLLRLVPAAPLLPACTGMAADFDPTLTAAQRQRHHRPLPDRHARLDR
jgi:hypothetical protein